MSDGGAAIHDHAETSEQGTDTVFDVGADPAHLFDGRGDQITDPPVLVADSLGHADKSDAVPPRDDHVGATEDLLSDRSRELMAGITSQLELTSAIAQCARTSGARGPERSELGPALLTQIGRLCLVRSRTGFGEISVSVIARQRTSAVVSPSRRREGLWFGAVGVHPQARSTGSPRYPICSTT